MTERPFFEPMRCRDDCIFEGVAPVPIPIGHVMFLGRRAQ